MSKTILDAATRAVREQSYDHLDDELCAAVAEAALRAALPAEPGEDVIEAMAEGLWEGLKRSKNADMEPARNEARAAYRALRAKVLGEEG